MSSQKDTWSSIFSMILAVATLDIFFVILAVSLPDSSIFCIVCIILSVVFAVVRACRVWSKAKKLEKLRQQALAEQARTKSAKGSVYGGSANNKTSTTTTTTTKASGFSELKTLARDYQTKAKRYSTADYKSVQDICRKLRSYLIRRGFKPADNMVEDLLRAMMSSRCIFVKVPQEKEENECEPAQILSIVAEFFSGMEGTSVELPATLYRASGLIYGYQNGALKETDFFKAIYGAPFFANNVYTCTIEGWSDVDFGQVFSNLIAYFKNPEEPVVFNLPQSVTGVQYIEDKRFKMPTNTWFFFLRKGNEQPLPTDASLWSSTIELHATGMKIYNYLDNETVAFTQFNELIDNAFDESFLPLEIWKKLDKVEDYLQESVGFKIDNVTARQIERMTTVYVACGGTQEAAMDIALAKKVLPAIARYKREQIDHENTTLKELIDGLFGIENLPETHKALTMWGLD